jgi:hypothetical protein
MIKSEQVDVPLLIVFARAERFETGLEESSIYLVSDLECMATSPTRSSD